MVGDYKWRHLPPLFTGWYELELAQSFSVAVQDRRECFVSDRRSQSNVLEWMQRLQQQACSFVNV
jgi:hypothetical protein